MAESLRLFTTLLTGYTSIQNKKQLPTTNPLEKRQTEAGSRFLSFPLLLLLLLLSHSVMSNSVQPHRRQPIRLPRPWDSPGKNTGVGCHFLLQCMKVKSESEVTQSCRLLVTPWTTAYQAPPSMGFSRRILEWGAIAFSASTVIFL